MAKVWHEKREARFDRDKSEASCELCLLGVAMQKIASKLLMSVPRIDSAFSKLLVVQLYVFLFIPNRKKK